MVTAKYQFVLNAVASTPWAIEQRRLNDIVNVLMFQAAGGKMSQEDIRATVGQKSARGGEQVDHEGADGAGVGDVQEGVREGVEQRAVERVAQPDGRDDGARGGPVHPLDVGLVALGEGIVAGDAAGRVPGGGGLAVGGDSEEHAVLVRRRGDSPNIA